MARKSTPEPHQISEEWVPETVEDSLDTVEALADEPPAAESVDEAVCLPPVVDRSARVLLEKIKHDEGPSTVSVFPHEIPVYRRIGWRVAGE